jgi:N-acetylglutamate synthase-like GNAT family acetyltransferase
MKVPIQFKRKKKSQERLKQHAVEFWIHEERRLVRHVIGAHLLTPRKTCSLNIN